MLEWLPAPIAEHELELRAKHPERTWPCMKLVSGPWVIAKWDLSDPRYALHRGTERWPKQFGFKTSQEAMDLANDMERRGV